MSAKCPDPKELHENASTKFQNMPITVHVITFEYVWFTFDIEKNASLWTKTAHRGKGNCFTLKVPQNVAEMGISRIRILSPGDTRFTTRMDFHLHHHGLFDRYFPHGSSAGIRLEAPASMTIPVDHEIIHLLDYDGHTCSNAENYNLYACRCNYVHKVSYI